jgi:hypothetical protein
MSDLLKDKKSKEQILRDIDTHLTELPPFTDKEQIIDRFLDGFKQHVELESVEEAQASVEDVVPDYQPDDEASS